jgi:hypothetical protein
VYWRCRTRPLSFSRHVSLKNTLIIAVIAPGEGGAAGKKDVASPVLMELLCGTTAGGAGHGLFHSRDMFPLKIVP